MQPPWPVQMMSISSFSTSFCSWRIEALSLVRVGVEQLDRGIEAALLEHHRVADEQHAVVEEGVRPGRVPGIGKAFTFLASAPCPTSNVVGPVIGSLEVTAGSS